MKVIKLVLFVLMIYACSCKSKLTGSQVMPGMLEIDSVEILYFKHIEDQRFYTYLPVNDKEFISDLVTDVTAEVQPEIKGLKEGKIYCFRNGFIINTLYFATDNPAFSFLRYIKNGKLYCFSISESTRKKINEFKKVAYEPVSADSNAQTH